MSLITKITTYNAPYEISSTDRFFQDVDTKLNKYKVAEEVKFSNAVANSTTMNVTINDGGRRVSYMRVESKLYPDTPVSYWFLTAVNRLESSIATQYAATLDAIATFGDAVFDKLVGNKIKIDRLHEDRYTFENNVFMMNTKHHGLVNSDFKLGDTKGVELVFDGANDENSSGIQQMKIEDVQLEGVRTLSVVDDNNIPIEFNNDIKINGKDYYLYALLNMSGEPQIYDQDTFFDIPNESGVGFVDETTRFGKNIRNSVIAPLELGPKDRDGNVVFLKTLQNTITAFQNLQENKVINIIKLPFKLEFPDLSEDPSLGSVDNRGVQMLFNNKGERYILTIARNGKDSLINTSTKDVKPLSDFTLISDETNKDKELIYSICFYSFIQEYFDTNNLLSIPTSKLSDDDIMEFIARTKTPAEMKTISETEPEKLEISLLNTDIMPINFKIHDLDKEIDMYNFYNKPDITKIAGKYTINELGLEATLEMSDNQYLEWSENTIMSFATNQGATYLARNKYTQDAQRKGIDIQKDISVAQARSREAQAGASAANPVSALFSFGASIASGASAAAYAGQEAELQKKLASNKKAQIQASIDDASATAPSLHTGSVHNLANLNTQEYKYNFNWVMKKPNKYLRDKIVNFYDRHGYVFHDWISFSKDMVLNRVKFNYIEMDEFKDFIGTFGNFDINVLNLIDAEFKKGIRLWHEDTINYNEPNLEKVIKENI